ncbi:hypothetical protein CXB51_010186 [Gossypium anomalum]|uniref:Piwi domain-containing protein n=1 Tax=Gossypium anomalum TaxID=47600 RepID=A0A8J5ZN94_9ROSI|nr:hypothetical protein CXB51_010186 [Gossypium anomalum]
MGQTPSIPVVSKVPTIILGMGALFGFPEQPDVLSIAAMILSSKPVSDKVDDGIMKEALLDFYTSLGKRKLDQIIIFRDGGSPDNVLHGTVIDNKAEFSADDLQEFVHSLSYMYQRSTTAIFVVAPICYAYLAASQLGAIYED